MKLANKFKEWITNYFEQMKEDYQRNKQIKLAERDAIFQERLRQSKDYAKELVKKQNKQKLSSVTSIKKQGSGFLGLNPDAANQMLNGEKKEKFVDPQDKISEAIWGKSKGGML